MGSIVGFHAVATMYGFWLPNDPRGSGSDFVRADHLRKWGPATKVTGRSVARKEHDIQVRLMAKKDLMFEPVVLTGVQARSVGKGFGLEIQKYGGVILACAILPSHVHLIIAPHRYDIRRFIGRLKGSATKQLKSDGLYPPTVSADAQHRVPVRETQRPHPPSPWSSLPWVKYLWTEAQLIRDIDYVEGNPLKEGKPKQSWSFVTSFEAYTRGATHRR